MGLALTTFSALSNPVRALTRWLQPAHHLQETLGDASPPIEEYLGGSSQLPGTNADPTSERLTRSPGLGAARPVRGNWPFTVSPPASRGEHNSRAVDPQNANAAQPGGRGAHHILGRAWNKSGCGAAPVQRGISLRRDTSRVMIAGRMADVCAELDRMAACEDGLQAH